MRVSSACKGNGRGPRKQGYGCLLLKKGGNMAKHISVPTVKVTVQPVGKKIKVVTRISGKVTTTRYY